MRIRPLFDKVIIKSLPADEVTKSGIVLPDTAERERPEKGEVVAVGPGKQRDNGEITKPSVKVGDKVVFRKYSPDEIKVDNVDYLVISESDIVGVLED